MLHFLEEIEFKDNVQRRHILCEKLKALQIHPKIQKFTKKKRTGENIIVTFSGKSQKKIIVGAHYDIWPKSGGANDNGAAVYILFQLIQHFAEMKDLQYSFELIFFDLEENHCLGSRMYVKSEDLGNIIAMINLDMCGIGDTLIFNQIVGNEMPLSSVLGSICDKESVPYSMLQHIPPSDDLPFSESGVKAISIGIMPNSVIPTVIRLANITRIKKFSWSKIKDSIHFMIDMIKGQKALDTMHSKTDIVETLSEESITTVLLIVQKFLNAINQLSVD